MAVFWGYLFDQRVNRELLRTDRANNELSFEDFHLHLPVFLDAKLYRHCLRQAKA